MTNLPATMAHLGSLGPAAGTFAGTTVKANVLNEGIGASFGILTFRGKVWRTKFRGEEHAHVLPPAAPGLPPAGPMPNVDVVIVHASPVVAKIFYEGQYAEGDVDAPDCFSVNGHNPDPASPKKQAEVCASCPKNIWGSKILPSGKAGKACQDSKRLVVVPLGDMNNEMFGGPMLLRVPPASLQDMGTYNNMLQQFGHAFFTVGTSLGFDMTTAFPKLTFTPLRALSDGEAAKVLELQNDPRTKRILSEAVDQVRHEALPAAAPQAQLTGPGTITAAGVADRDPSYQYTDDGLLRWKAPMPAWEAVPPPTAVAAAPMPAPAVAPVPAPAPQPPVVAAPIVAPVPVPAVAPVMTAPPFTPPAAPAGEMPPLPAFLTRTQQGGGAVVATAPLAAAPPTPAPVAIAPVAPAPPVEAPFKVLSPDELAALTPPEMMAYVPKLTAHMATQQAAPPKARASRKTQATTPPPSPANATPPPIPGAAVAPPVSAPVAPAIPPAVAAPLPTEAAPVADAAMAGLDDKLSSLLAS